MEKILIKKAFKLANKILKEINNDRPYLDKDNYCKYYQGICWSTWSNCQKCKYRKESR